MINFKDTLAAYKGSSFEEQLKAEQAVFQKFQSHDFLEYKKERLAHLAKLSSGGELKTLISYIKYHQPKIGVFAGSFSPFHKGHYNVLQKAERIFDKVIIAFGKNPE
jgi:pantetheine-phosphate adenylyltransferase